MLKINILKIKIFILFNYFLTIGCTGIFVATDTSSDSSIGAVSLKSSFICQNPNQSNISGAHFLSKKQYLNTIEDLFGSQILSSAQASVSALPDDAFNEELRVKTSSLSPENLQAYFNVSKSISEGVLATNARRNAVFGTCSGSTVINQTCIDNFIQNFALRVLRRPVNQDERDFINQIFQTSGTNSEKLKAVLNYLLQSPYFIWRIELGHDSNASTEFELTDYESASRLSYMLTDSTPDLILLEDVRQGVFKTSEQKRAHAARLIESQRGRTKAINMIMHWSHSSNPRDLSGLPDELKAGVQMSGLENAMVEESRNFIEHIVFSSDGKFEDLLKSKLSFASHPGLASIYSHSPVQNNIPVEFTERRQGLLMRAPFMTWYNPRTNIIERGVHFQKRVLCNLIPSPNVDVADDRDSDSFSSEQQLSNSNRINIAHQTRSPVCMGCHSAINPTGFAFENFDSLGRIRNQEMVFDLDLNFLRFLDIDSRTSLGGFNGKSVSLNDGYDLINNLAASSEGHECFVRTAHRYINELQETSKDSCHLNQAFENLANSKLSIKDVLIDIALNPNLNRKISNE